MCVRICPLKIVVVFTFFFLFFFVCVRVPFHGERTWTAEMRKTVLLEEIGIRRETSNDVVIFSFNCFAYNICCVDWATKVMIMYRSEV